MRQSFHLDSYGLFARDQIGSAKARNAGGLADVPGGFIQHFSHEHQRRRAAAAKRWNKEKETPSQPRKAAPTGKASDNTRNGTDWMVKYMK